MKRPTLDLAIAINAAVRADDEWFDEPDELDRLQKALASIDNIEDPVVASAVIAYRVARAQAFGEGNKRTGLLLARWILDNNDINGALIIPADDFDLAGLLVKAASGSDVQTEIINLLMGRQK